LVVWPFQINGNKNGSELRSLRDGKCINGAEEYSGKIVIIFFIYRTE
jgi:hypothetical protein